MSLQLIISDPHTLTDADRAAICAFAQITGFVVEGTLPPTVAIQQIENGFPTIDKALIAEEDRPDVGVSRWNTTPFVTPNPFEVFANQTAVPELEAAEASVPVPPPQSLSGPAPEGSAALQWAFGMSAPTPPAAPFEPSADTAPIAALVPAVDSAGFPWDHRIHATTKGRNMDGRWKKKKNVDEAVIGQIELDLRQTYAAPPAPGAPLEPGEPTTPPALFAWAAAQMAKGALTQGVVFAAVSAVGLPNPLALTARPDLVPAVYAQLRTAAGMQ